MKPEIDLCVPALQSNDAVESYAFYHLMLGFEKNWDHRYEPGLPLFIPIPNGVSMVFITEYKDESAFDMELYLYANGACSIESNAKTQGAVFDVELHEMLYGAKEFTINDPGGNKLRIGQRMT